MPHLSEIGQLSDAIFTCRNVVICLTMTYLHSARNQFEMELMERALVDRYGRAAFAHIIFIIFGKQTVNMLAGMRSLLPLHLREHFRQTVLVWHADDFKMQCHFWVELLRRLS